MNQKSILIVGDKKDDASKYQRKDYADGNGRLFWHILYTAGLNVRDVGFRYLSQGKPDITGAKVVITLGQEAFNAFGTGSIRKNRGSISSLGNGTWLIPTLHPRTLKKPFEVFRESQVETAQLVLFDIQKAAKVYRNGFELPREDFTLEPTIEELEDFVKESLEYPYIGVDLEGTGLNLDFTDIVTVGFALSRTRAFVVPIFKEEGQAYWSLDEVGRARKALTELLTNRKLLFQNGYGYDVPLLRRDGYEIPWENFLADTMLVHHALDPELPHNIGFINSVWGHQEYWKESFLDRKEHIFDTNQLEMRRYNARDCTALIDIYESMMKEVKERGLEHIVKKEMEIVPPVVIMKERGIGKDLNKTKSWQKWITKEVEELDAEVRKTLNLPAVFNFNSIDHKGWLLYGHASEGLLKKKEKLKDYDITYNTVQYTCVQCGSKRSFKYIENKSPGTIEAKCSKCRQSMPFERTELAPKEVKAKSRETKVYQSLNTARTILEIDPLEKPDAFRPSRTESGKYGSGSEDIARFLNAVHARQTKLDELKRPQEKHRLEAQGLERTDTFLQNFQRLAKLIKLRASFYDVPVGQDKRIHPTILIQGTATARFSCIEPNAQQIPNARSVAGSKVRDLFRTIDSSYVLLSADYSNLEVNVGARFMVDEVLLSQLEQGLNIHDENTKLFFETDEHNPRWSQLRAISKVIQFGRLFYGGSDRGIYSKVRTADPNSGLTFGNFEKAVSNYFRKHSGFTKFVAVVQTRARETRESVNGYGRVRRLYGSAQSLPRQALNSPIQGTAGDFMIDTMIRLWQRGLGNKYESYICLQIHDELLFMVKKSESKEVFKIIKEEMERPQTIRNYQNEEVSFSVDIDAEVGTNWGTMEAIDLETGVIGGASKH